MTLFRPIPALQRAVKNYKAYREGCRSASEFNTAFAPQIADSDALKKRVFSIRHQVYCDELKLEPVQASGLERDAYDAYSHHGLIHCDQVGQSVGTVRVIAPQQSSQHLPIEAYCLDSITNTAYSPQNFDRHEICEISRLAVPRQFRKATAQAQLHQGAGEHVMPMASGLIAVGLYFTAASLAYHTGRRHAYVMVEPRLARRMSMVGIEFIQVGPVVNYHGQRAPFYIDRDRLINKMKPAFRRMYDEISLRVASELISRQKDSVGDASDVLVPSL